MLKRFAIRPFLLGLLSLVSVFAAVNAVYHRPLFGDNIQDSYALEAKAWHAGHSYLPMDYHWLELATYHGHIYVSFPPVPAVVDYLSLAVYPDHVPSNFIVMLYALGSYAALYGLCRRMGTSEKDGVLWALFTLMGSSFMTIAAFGGVWFLAQLLCLLLTALSLYCMKGKTPFSWGLGLFFLALAAGCRPFQLLYLPLYLLLLFRNMDWKWSVARLIPYAIAPAVVLAILGWYNWLRFGNPAEFGHNYLPEFLPSNNPQFSLKYVPSNFFSHLLFIPVSLRPPHMWVPAHNGFLFFAANPLFVAFAARLKGFKKLDPAVKIIFGLSLFNLLLILSHDTMGGLQFGSRYTADLLPFILFAILTVRLKLNRLDRWLAGFGIALNLYGAVVLMGWL